MYVNLYIQDEQLSTYKDESIPFEGAIIDTTDITKIKTDFSRAFTVPANRNNNQIFSHYYNANVDNTYDARVVVAGRIEIDGVLFRKGKWSLNKVNVENNQPVSYNINFTGNLLNIKDTIGDDELKDLDLSEFDHDFTIESVTEKMQWADSNDYHYPLFATKQLSYNTDPSDNTETETLVNIANNNATIRGIDFKNLRPSLRVSKIFEAIQTKYGFTFSNNFFGRDDFTKLHLRISNTTDQINVEPQVINLDSGNSPFTDYVNNEHNLTNPSGNINRVNFNLNFYPEDNTIPYKIIIELDDEGEVVETGWITGYNYSNNYVQGGRIPNTVRHKVIAEQELNYSIILNIGVVLSPGFSSFQVVGTGTFQTPSFSIERNMPKIKTIDFVNAFIKAFKLVVIPTSETDFYVNTLDDYYNEGSVILLDKYTDLSKHDVSRSDVLKSIDYGFEETDTILNKVFKENTGDFYGDESLTLLDDDTGDILDGQEVEIKLPFENILYERIRNLKNNQLTLIGYGGVFDKEIKPTEPSAVVHYSTRVDIFNPSNNIDQRIKIKETDSVVAIEDYFAPSHTVVLNNFISTDPSFAFLFSSEFSYYNNALLTNNLYTKYHENFIRGVFLDKKVRKYVYKSQLNTRILNELSLNDIIVINNNFLRIDKFETDLTTGDSTLTLFTDYSKVNQVPSFTSIDETSRIYYPYDYDSILKVDTGFGVGWFTVTFEDGFIVIALDENTTGSDRYANVEVIENAVVQTTIDISQIVTPEDTGQTINILTADNGFITADNNIITVDNG